MSPKGRQARRRASAEAFFAYSPEKRVAEDRLAATLARHKNDGIQFVAAGRHWDALKEFRTALKNCPTHAEVWYLCGFLLSSMGEIESKYLAEGYEYLAQAVILTPRFSEAQEKLAKVGAVIGRPATILTPWVANPAPINSARFLRSMRNRIGLRDVDDFMPIDPDEAYLRSKLLKDSTNSSAAMKLGRVLVRQSRFVEAEKFLRYALALKPWFGEAAAWLCLLLGMLSRRDEIKSVAKEALDSGAFDDRLSVAALWSGLVTCDWSDYDHLLERVLRILEEDPALVDPHAALHVTDRPDLQLVAAKSYSACLTAGCRPLKIPQRSTPESSERGLTLGYVSAEFIDHAGARLLAGLFEHHDRKRFKVHGYSLVPDDGSSIGRRLRSAVDKFTELTGATHEALARRILEDQVDILIDESGYTRNSQPRIVAYRPAPIQVSYLGYPGTLGTSAVDYAIVDKVVVADEQRQCFTEALVQLPYSYQVNDLKRWNAKALRPKSEYGLPNQGVVFCSFNQTQKILPNMFSIWMRILGRVPGSVLWLLTSDSAVMYNLRAEAFKLEIDPERLIFGPRLLHDDHLQRHTVADLFLDTQPCGAHTSASDALLVGCPVLTILGRSFPGRVAASLLEAAGLPELIMQSFAEYEAFAVRFGLDADLRAEVKARLDRVKGDCPLFDAPLFTRHLEWAYSEMWRRHMAGQAPASFEVPRLSPKG